MKNLDKYRGIFPAFYACYDTAGEVSPERTEQLVQYYIDKGIKGLYVCGSSGECIYQDVEERKIILESVMRVAKDKITVIAHVACNNTRDSKILAAHAQSLGVDAIAAIPPIYFKLPDYAIEAYWNDISAAAPDTDFMIYNIPQLAGVALTAALYKNMLKNKNVIGVKNSSMATFDIQIFKAIGGDDCVVFNGPDEQLVAGLAIGADGGIGGTYGVMVDLFLKLYALILSGKRKEAILLQNDINEIITILCSGHGNMYAMIKEVLRRRNNINIGGVRKPLADIIESDDAIIKTAIEKLDLAYQKHLLSE